MYAKDMALKAIKKYKTRDPFEICRQKNIEIIYSDLEPDVAAYINISSANA